MNHIVKAVVLSLGALSTVGLTACQSSNATHTPTVSKSIDEKHKSHKRDFDHKRRHHDKLTEQERAEKRADMQQRIEARKQQREEFDKSCEGKINQTIAVKVDNRTIEGTCKVTFLPNRSDAKINKMQ